MNFYTAERSAAVYLESHPLHIPADQPDPAAYRRACQMNLALALVQRADSLMAAGMDEGEAAVEAAKETRYLAEALPDPTPALLAQAAEELAAEAADLAEDA